MAGDVAKHITTCFHVVMYARAAWRTRVFIYEHLINGLNILLRKLASPLLHSTIYSCFSPQYLSCGYIFMFSFAQVMWRALKHLIDTKGKDLILALDFHLLKGVHGTF